MPAQANIILADGQTTPVNHTFNPNGAIGQADKSVVAEWQDRSPSAKVGFLTITEQYKPTNGNGMEKFRFVIDAPVLETPGSTVVGFEPKPTKAFSTLAVIEIMAHERASAQNLKDIVAFVKNFTAHTYFKDSIENRERPW
jgi:hypothetical protein